MSAACPAESAAQAGLLPVRRGQAAGPPRLQAAACPTHPSPAHPLPCTPGANPAELCGTSQSSPAPTRAAGCRSHRGDGSSVTITGLMRGDGQTPQTPTGAWGGRGLGDKPHSSECGVQEMSPQEGWALRSSQDQGWPLQRGWQDVLATPSSARAGSCHRQPLHPGSRMATMGMPRCGKPQGLSTAQEPTQR